MRLIDADELLKKFVISESGARIPEIDINGFPVRVMIKEVKDVIRQQPTVLQEPERKHGEWEIELDEYEDEADMICSSCRALHIFETVEAAKRRAKGYSFCPDCGAIMDGKEPIKDEQENQEKA